MREAAVLRTINHPNVVGFRGFTISEGDNPVLLMEKGDHSLMDLIEERNGSSLEIFKPVQIMKVSPSLPLNAVHSLLWFPWNRSQSSLLEQADNTN